ncbi:MAG TPA: NAD(P)H-binding protein [Rhizobacter sp.]
MYVLLGSNGQVSAQIARRLRANGHPVRVIGRSAASLAPLARLGAEPAIGEPADAAFLARAFTGATAVFTMIPPCYGEADMQAAQDRIGEAIATALRTAHVARVVNLSSIGAELRQGTGPIEALHRQERRLDAIAGLDLLHLRPGSFMENLLPAAAAISAAGVLPGMEAPDVPIPMVATRDVAALAARELAEPRERGVRLLHAPRHLSLQEAASALGAAIGMPELPYVQSAPEDAKAMLRLHGFSASAADQLEALARWLSTTAMASVAASPVAVQPTTIETFAREVFAPAYQALGAAPASAPGDTQSLALGQIPGA